jgi:hypothetical protein
MREVATPPPRMSQKLFEGARKEWEKMRFYYATLTYIVYRPTIAYKADNKAHNFSIELRNEISRV